MPKRHSAATEDAALISVPSDGAAVLAMVVLVIVADPVPWTRSPPPVLAVVLCEIVELVTFSVALVVRMPPPDDIPGGERERGGGGS